MTLYSIPLLYLFPDLVRWRKSPLLWLCDFIQYIFVLSVSRLGKVEEVAAAVGFVTLYSISLFYLFPDLVRWRKSLLLWVCDFIQYTFALFVSRLGKVEEVAAAVGFVTLYSISLLYLFPDLVRWRKSPLLWAL